MSMETPISCGTLVVNNRGELLLCHVTGTKHWDIPKGMRDPGESMLEAARRELREETGIQFDEDMFEELGCFDYRKDKRLCLFKVAAPNDFHDLGHLLCSSYFPHIRTGESTPEVDAFRWATREDVRTLCWPRMAQRLLSIHW
jgi:putative (di)nucleoside polyphosphate hydrolase